MERFFKRKSKVLESSSSTRDDELTNQSRIEVDPNDIEADPGIRKKITSYHPNDVNNIRRAYWLKGPCQPKSYDFPFSEFGNKSRRFNSAWFSEFSGWLEYSKAKDSAFCLCCYLFKQDVGEKSGGDSFVGEGFRNWKKKERLHIHVGGPNSAHNRAFSHCEDLVKQSQHIETMLFKQSNLARTDYRTRLNASLDCIRYLLLQGLPFRGHDESDNSSNKGNFLSLLKWLANQRSDISNVLLNNAPQNHKLTSPDIQKDIVSASAIETINILISDIGDEFFSILVDESRDESVKEQMAVALRYVNKEGHLIESFIGVEHVTNTRAVSLKEAIDALFSRHGLSISKIRGQGYNGANNMQGEFNGLKTLIQKENESAYYIHCFAHQLQLALVAVAKNHSDISWFFNSVANIVNVVGASCKRNDTIREIQANKVIEALNNGEIQSGRGLNQETAVQRHCETRWGSYYRTLVSLLYMFSSVVDVLDIIREDGSDLKQRGEARGLLFLMHQFDFVFNLHLMKSVLAITHELSLALQRKEQDIVNAMNLVDVSKQRLQSMRVNGWDSFIGEVSSFCEKHGLEVANMEENYLSAGRSRRKGCEITNLHHYRVELFYTVLDLQLQELNNRFNETTSELLICAASLNPSASFYAFDKAKLMRLASFYPKDFSGVERSIVLGDQLDTYYFDVTTNSEFQELSGLGSLCHRMVQTRTSIIYPLVYRLVKLALVLPVATATVERAFSAMKIVKTRLRNRMGDQFLNDSLVVYIERDVFDRISNETIIQRFQKMKNRREQL